MESALSLAPATTLLTLTKTLQFNFQLSRRFIATRPIQTHLSRRIFNGELHSLHKFTSITSNSVKTLSTAVVRPCRGRLHCVSSSAASFGSGGGGIGGGSGGGGGGGGDGAVNGGEEKAKAVADGSETSNDVIILDVGGMSCGGCVASVKRILESQPQVSSASVNLTTETAVVWPVSDAKSVPDWQKTVGTELAKHLTSCGFQSNLRGERSTTGDVPS